MRKITIGIILCCATAILALPLYFDPGAISAFLFPKAILFQVFSEISIAAYLILQLYHPAYRVNWHHPLICVNGVFIVLLIILSLTGLDVSRSLWSTLGRMNGVIIYLHLFLWFVVLSSVIKTWEVWRRLIWVSIGICFLVTAYGFGQWIVIEGIYPGVPISRIEATLGNPIFLAQYIILNVFLGLLLFIKEKNASLRLILLFFGIAGIAAVFLSLTRSGVLTLEISAVIFGVLCLVTFVRNRHIIIYGIIIGLIITSFIGAAYLWFLTPEGVKWSQTHIKYEQIRRVTTELFFDPARIELSRIAWQGFLDRPLLGFGPNNYTYIFSQYVKPQDYGVLFMAQWYDYPHNEILNILATMGIVGLTGYIGIWIVVSYSLIKKLWWGNKSNGNSSKNDQLALIVLAVFFSSYLLQIITGLNAIAPLIMLYFGFGLLYFMTPMGSTDKTTPYNDRQHYIVPTMATKSLSIFFVGALMVPIIFVSIIPYLNVRTAKKAIDISNYNFTAGKPIYKKSLSGFSFVEDEIRLELARAAVTYAKKYPLSGETRREVLLYAISELEKSERRHPYLLEYMMWLLALYREYALYDSTILSRAETLAQRLLDRYPNRRDVLKEYTFIKLKQ
ncbi:MAG: O-antigen ligase family protein [Planctomycetes bacterium]|nr:O-antigen ligase family protein [Planctomycetota bacterium]